MILENRAARLSFTRQTDLTLKNESQVHGSKGIHLFLEELHIQLNKPTVQGDQSQ
jgi:hypothetical protein